MIFTETSNRAGNFEFDNSKRSYTRTFDVQTDCTDTEADIYAGGGPVLGEVHDADSLAYCIKLNLSQRSGILWTLTCSYATLSPQQKEKKDNPLPQNRATVWRGSFTKTEYIANTDCSAVPLPYINSAGDPFAEGLAYYQGLATFSGTKNYLTFDFDAMTDWQYCVNDAIWNGLPKYSVRLDGVEWSQKTEQVFGSPWSEVNYFELTFNFTCNKNLWIPTKVLDKGYRSLQGSPPELRQIRDSRTGQVKAEPSLLDGAGVLLADGLDPVELEFVQYYELDFTTFGL